MQIFFLLIRRKSVLHVQFVFLLIRSISLEPIFIVVPRLALHDLIFFCLHVLLTRASLLAVAKSIYYCFKVHHRRTRSLVEEIHDSKSSSSMDFLMRSNLQNVAEGCLSVTGGLQSLNLTEEHSNVFGIKLSFV